MDFKTHSRAIGLVKSSRTIYDTKTRARKQTLKEVYRETMDYDPPKEMDWDSSLKVNFMNAREQLFSAKLTAKKPKAIVSLNQNPIEIAEEYLPEGVNDEQKQEFIRDITKDWVLGVQDYLNKAFDSDLKSTIRRGAKQFARTGNVYGRAKFKFETYKEKEKTEKGWKITEKITKQYPTIEIISLQELYFDPRFFYTKDMPAVIRRHENVRLSELVAMKNEEGMMNLDRIRTNNLTVYNTDKSDIYRLFIPNDTGTPIEMDTSTLTVDEYYGYFSENGDPEDEVLYEIWVVNDSLCVRMRPITEMPIKSAGFFEDCEQHFSIGLGETLMGLQREYNFKMNSAIEYINQNLNHTYLFDPQSGIDPRMLMYANAPKAVIPVSQGIENAVNGLKEIERRPIDPNYFANQNEIRNDMETVSFSVNALSSGSRPGSSETATGTKAAYYDSNIVTSDVLAHFEEWLEDLCYDMLECLFENHTDDKIVQEIGVNRYKWLSKEIFKKAKLRYLIKIDIGSSSLDSQENRREDALAKLTVLQKAVEAGEKPEMREAIKDILATFENTDPNAYFPPVSGMDMLQGMPGMPGTAPNNMNPGLPAPENLGGIGKVLGASQNFADPNAISQSVVGNVVPSRFNNSPV
jgi:hypothetical protein